MTDEGKLFVGGLSFETDEESLEEAFSKYGPIVKVDVVRDRESRRSKGFGFVTFENPQDAKDALAAMNGRIVDGRQIHVDEAGKSGGRSGGFRGGQGGRGFSRGGRRGGRGYMRGSGGGYDDWSSGERSYGGGRGYGGGRNYGGSDERNYRSGGGGGGGYSRGGYRDSRSQGAYGERSGERSYRDQYDSYTTNE